MTDSTSAAASLHAADQARQRAVADSRWFPWACVAMGLIVIPGGMVVPWEMPVRLIVIAITFAALLALVWGMGRKRATPRGSKTGLTMAVGSWIALSVLVSTLGNDVEHFGPALALSAVASIPFFVLAVRLRSGRNLSR
ncbi:hypothetical protein [Arthrobacter luteolus]|uniref:hypothetical protein n=1 Tax=Arthrobacter luteolus TaxID=98672 RepID=UPI00384F384E